MPLWFIESFWLPFSCMADLPLAVEFMHSKVCLRYVTLVPVSLMFPYQTNLKIVEGLTNHLATPSVVRFEPLVVRWYWSWEPNLRVDWASDQLWSSESLCEIFESLTNCGLLRAHLRYLRAIWDWWCEKLVSRCTLYLSSSAVTFMVIAWRLPSDLPPTLIDYAAWRT